MARSRALLPLLLLSSLGCSKLGAKKAEPAAAADSARAAEHAAAAPAAPPGVPVASGQGEPGAGRYGVPFAWQISPDEPLARARRFVGEVLDANAVFMGQGRSHFTSFAQAEHPRATVLTCSDSRIQPGVWDASPEDDSYTVRNLGNQLATSLGSVAYGVERLHTPVLLIVGHTGCDAVERALHRSGDDKGPVADDLAHMQLGAAPRKGDEQALLEGVTSNVNAQVAQAVSHFGGSVQSGELTVIGAVYDIGNELQGGHGRLHIINVNGNVDAARLEAFEKAVREKPSASAAGGKRAGGSQGSAIPLDRARLLPDGRASISAVSILGAGAGDAADGTLGAPNAGRRRASSAQRNELAANIERVAASMHDPSAPAPAPSKPVSPPKTSGVAPGH